MDRRQLLIVLLLAGCAPHYRAVSFLTVEQIRQAEPVGVADIMVSTGDATDPLHGVATTLRGGDVTRAETAVKADHADVDGLRVLLWIQPRIATIRLVNHSAEPVNVNWSSGIYTSPEGFSSPVSVVRPKANVLRSSEPLAVIPPEGAVEYQLVADHWYPATPDAAAARRDSRYALGPFLNLAWTADAVAHLSLSYTTGEAQTLGPVVPRTFRIAYHVEQGTK